MSDKNRAEKRLILKQGKRQRIFSYSLGECKLEFTLQTDMKTQLKDFLELLSIAYDEVAEELAA